MERVRVSCVCVSVRVLMRMPYVTSALLPRPQTAKDMAHHRDDDSGMPEYATTRRGRGHVGVSARAFAEMFTQSICART